MNDRIARVPRDAFRCCRWSMAALMWLGVLTGSLLPIALVWLHMLVSAVVTMRWSPVPWLYTRTLHRRWPSEYEELSIPAMRFSHSIASVLIGLPLLLVLLGGPRAVALGWRWLTIMAIIKTVAAVTGCPAAKLFTCATSGDGTCCAFLRRKAG